MIDHELTKFQFSLVVIASLLTYFIVIVGIEVVVFFIGPPDQVHHVVLSVISLVALLNFGL